MSVSIVRREHRVEFSDGYVSAYLPLHRRMWIVTAYKKRGSGFSRAHTCRRASEQSALEKAREMAKFWDGPYRPADAGTAKPDCRVCCGGGCDHCHDTGYEGGGFPHVRSAE
jgi:hypothetical protein